MRSTNFQKLLIVAALSICVLTSNSLFAQATINADDLKAQMVKDWQRAKEYTDEYLSTMPADKYGFKAVDSIRSFAQQMLHLSQANVNLISAGTGKAKIFPDKLETITSAQTADSVKYYVNASYDYAIDAISKLDAAKLGEKINLRNTELTRLTWINKAFEHQTHHRGQTTIYIRLLGIRPPGERLF